LGKRNATLKASVISEAPKALAISVSLSNPVMRESMVMLLTLAAADNRFTVVSFAYFDKYGYSFNARL
jgi:hypothetical protein